MVNISMMMTMVITAKNVRRKKMKIEQMKKEELIALATAQKATIGRLKARNTRLLAEVRFMYRQMDFILTHIQKVKDSGEDYADK